MLLCPSHSKDNGVGRSHAISAHDTGEVGEAGAPPLVDITLSTVGSRGRAQNTAQNV